MKRNEDLDNLFKEILKLENLDECYAFFEDLCTYKELESFQERIKAAKLLISGKTYEEIIKEANISSATLSRVSKCVKYGEGYKTIISKENKNGIE